MKASDAPFQYHLFVFNADGTMQQANPDAGDANTSDSDGKGIWKNDSNKVKGKFVEITADRVTHNFASSGEISFEIAVGSDKNTFAGTANGFFYDVNGKLLKGPLSTPLEGTRLTIP